MLSPAGLLSFFMHSLVRMWMLGLDCLTSSVLWLMSYIWFSFVGILSFTCPSFWENTACTGFSQEEAQTRGKKIICQFPLKVYFPKGVWAAVFPIKHPVSIYVLYVVHHLTLSFPPISSLLLPIVWVRRTVHLDCTYFVPPLTFKQGVWHLNEPNVLNASSY